MKINIFFPFDKFGGGGNQFLKTLKGEFIKKGIYEEVPEKADVVLFNSHHNFYDILKFKYKNPGKLLVHRLAGPVIEGRGKNIEIDKMIYAFNRIMSDATIFQSAWSRRANYKYGLRKNIHETTIINAPNADIFNNNDKKENVNNNRTTIVASSWSSNIRKGFPVYQHLDERLDFNKFEMFFIGNSPVTFKNIKIIKPLKSEDLGKKLKEFDIYITASKGETCSNSLIEALHCGLPSIGLNDGGNPDIISEAGEVFEGVEDVISKIELVANNYSRYIMGINLPSIDVVAEKYATFIKNIYDMTINSHYKVRHVRIIDYAYLLFFERSIYFHRTISAILRKYFK